MAAGSALLSEVFGAGEAAVNQNAIEGGDPLSGQSFWWIPAYAGMTASLVWYRRSGFPPARE